MGDSKQKNITMRIEQNQPTTLRLIAFRMREEEPDVRWQNLAAARARGMEGERERERGRETLSEEDARLRSSYDEKNGKSDGTSPTTTRFRLS